MATKKIKISETPKVKDINDFIVLGVDQGTNESAHADMTQLRGNEGKSAYEVAVDNGFIGTEEEWLESIRGDENVYIVPDSFITPDFQTITWDQVNEAYAAYKAGRVLDNNNVSIGEIIQFYGDDTRKVFQYSFIKISGDNQLLYIVTVDITPTTKTISFQVTPAIKQTDLDNLEGRINDRIDRLIDNIGRIHGIFKVRFISPVDTVEGNGERLIAETLVFPDGSVSLPTPPDKTAEGLRFVGWTHTADDLRNIQHDIDVGALYETISGDTEIEFTLTDETGLEPNMYLILDPGTELTVDRGDGSTDIVTASPYNPAYATAGTYRARFTQTAGSGGYSLGGGTNTTAFFGGNNTAYRTCLKKVYMGQKCRISDYGLYFMSGLRSVVIRPDYTVPSVYTLSTALQLRSLVLPPGIVNLLAATNDYGSSNRYTVIPDSVKSIGPNSLARRQSATRIIIPASVTAIYSKAFSDNTAMEEYIFLSKVPPTLANVDVFANNPASCKRYVPDDSVDAYRTATNWVTYADQIYPISSKIAV